jgi:hypothetical protein
MDEIKLYVHTATIRKYFEYFLWRNGIMEVTTIDVKYKRSLKSDPNYIDFQGFLQAMNFLQSTDISGDPNIPDLRTTMYWEAGHWLENKSTIVFPLSDDTGKFLYQFMAISESGETVTKQGTLVVR